ncbi:MAG TPA: Crp/Fnr family transcriptional regulator [Gemmatimonadaceae bacterium]|nr:Crp/Fnr family transcriptional regulator [Gemmatimonadaceae bacterium]
MDIVPLLRALPLFRELDDPSLGRLAQRCVARDMAEGQVLFTTGEPCRGLYIVQAGRVRIYRVSAEGREQVLHIEGPGSPVAELPLFDGGPYPASAVAIEAGRLVFVPRAEFEALVRANAEFAAAVIRGLGRRLRHLVHVTETLAFRDVAARLAHLLAGYAEEAGAHPGHPVELRIRRTQEELALEIGTARESVSRAMKALRKRGLVQAAPGGRLRIPDVERLRSVARGTDVAP